MKKSGIVFLVILFLATLLPFKVEAGGVPEEGAVPQETAAGGSYTENMKTTYDRGYKNIFTSPAEIGIGVRDYAKKEPPVLNYLAGFGVGTAKFFRRLGSGLWDLVAALIPKHQEGMPVEPEALV